MAYITQTILEADLGATLVTRLTRGSATRLARWITSAEARVASALQIGGYTAAVPSSVFAANASDCPAEITELALRVWKRLAYERGADLSIPEDQIRQLDQELLDLQEGRIEIKGLTRSTARAPGGVLASDGSPTSTSSAARPQVFGRSRMVGF